MNLVRSHSAGNKINVSLVFGVHILQVNAWCFPFLHLLVVSE